MTTIFSQFKLLFKGNRDDTQDKPTRKAFGEQLLAITALLPVSGIIIVVSFEHPYTFQVPSESNRTLNQRTLSSVTNTHTHTSPNRF